MKKVTVRDVAALAGVSSSTVSRVLNNHPTISPKTQKIVRDACKALNYVPDIAVPLRQRALPARGLVCWNNT